MKKLFLALLLSLICISAHAGGPAMYPATINQSSDTDSENRVYAGLKWTLNKGAKPEAVIGYRHARVKSNGDVHGGDISFSFSLLDAFQAGKIRTKYFDGKEKVQGEISAGYDFANGLFIGAGAKAPFSNIGVDYSLSGNSAWEAYFSLDTLKKYDKPRKNTTLSCNSGDTLNNATGQCTVGGGGP